MNLRRERSIANDHLVTGEMEGVADGTGSRVEPIAGSELTERAGRLVIPAGGTAGSDDDVRTLRDSDQLTGRSPSPRS